MESEYDTVDFGYNAIPSKLNSISNIVQFRARKQSYNIDITEDNKNINQQDETIEIIDNGISW